MMRSAAMDDFVARVKAGSDILPTVAAYVPLKQKGHNFWGCCPFHQEKTPSFSVTPDKGFFYCFGCHVGGDAIKFISLIEGISYFDAIKLQAEKLHIPMPQREKSAEEIRRDQHRQDLYKVLEMARDFFHNCLTKTGYGKPALAYLAGRGIGPEIIEEFKLGFAPQAQTKLLDAFTKRGVPLSLLVESGLVGEADNGRRHYDRFRGRFMIPIADERGRVVAFGGRVLEDGSQLAKYLNSPETALFNKRRLLFGLDRSHQAIRSAGYAIIVEGYMDAISLFAGGVKNVAASLGTAFTVEQCRLLLRYAPELYFCYDSDEAGQKATIRALSIVKETGARVKVLVVPDGKDPDEFIRKHGAQAFTNLTRSALPLGEYQLQYVLKHQDYRTLEGKAAALQAALPVLQNAATVVEQNEYVRRLASALVIDEGVIRNELRGYRPRQETLGPVQAPLRQAVRRVDNAVLMAGRIVLRRVWQEPEALAELLAYAPADSFPDEGQRELVQSMEKFAAAGRAFTEPDFLAGLSEAAQTELSHLLVEETGGIAADGWAGSVRRLRRNYLLAQQEIHRTNSIALMQANDPRAMEELAEMQRLKQAIDELGEA